MDRALSPHIPTISVFKSIFKICLYYEDASQVKCTSVLILYCYKVYWTSWSFNVSSGYLKIEMSESFANLCIKSPLRSIFVLPKKWNIISYNCLFCVLLFPLPPNVTIQYRKEILIERDRNEKTVFINFLINTYMGFWFVKSEVKKQI